MIWKNNRMDLVRDHNGDTNNSTEKKEIKKIHLEINDVYHP